MSRVRGPTGAAPGGPLPPRPLLPSLPPLLFAEEGGREPRAAVQQELSDMDYLKSKMVTSESLSSSEEEGSEDEAVSCVDGSEAVRQDGGGRAAGPEQDAPSRDKRPGAAGAEVCA